MVQKQRILYWDVVKAFAIFLVVLGHCMQFLTHDGFIWNSPLNSFIVTFHMPLFMMVSGYFASSVLKGEVKSTATSKFRQLFVPSVTTYFAVGIILLVLKRKFGFEGLLSILSYCASSFWYLKALFVFYVISASFVWLRSKNKYLQLLALLLLLLPASVLDYVHCISTLPYFLVGLLLRKRGGQFWKHKLAVCLVSATIYLTLVSLYDIQQYNMYTNPFGWRLEQLEIYAVRLIVGISGSFVALILLKAICDKINGTTIERQIAKVGTYTLGIYIFQYEILRFGTTFLIGVYDRLNILSGTPYRRFFFDVVLCVPTTILIIMVSIVIIKILRKRKCLRLVFLGEK